MGVKVFKYKFGSQNNNFTHVWIRIGPCHSIRPTENSDKNDTNEDAAVHTGKRVISETITARVWVRIYKYLYSPQQW